MIRVLGSPSKKAPVAITLTALLASLNMAAEDKSPLLVVKPTEFENLEQTENILSTFYRRLVN